MKYCESCAEGHIVKEATVRMSWDLGEKWICEDCAYEIMDKLLIEKTNEKSASKEKQWRPS